MYCGTTVLYCVTIFLFYCTVELMYSGNSLLYRGMSVLYFGTNVLNKQKLTGILLVLQPLSNHKVSRARPFNQLKKNTISCKELAFITRVNPDISGWPPLT